MSVTNTATGDVSQQVQSHTELADGMNYLSNGQWIEAQDLVEATPGGAQAVHGQMTATFNSDITSKGAMSLTTAGGEVFQSHPIGLFYADSASGKVAQIASVQTSVGTLYPPNVIVFSNVLSGVRADLMLVWAKNGYEQNLVLKQSPPRPESFGLSSGTTTLQFWTAMDNVPTPQQQRSVTLNSGLVDHIFHFKDCWMPVGSAFAFGTVPLPPHGQAAPVRPTDPSLPGTIQVAKSLENIAGSTVLVEEIEYTDLLPLLSTLPQASLSPKPTRTVELAQRGQFLVPGRASASASPRPIQIASAPYRPKAVTLDYTILNGSASSYIFTNTTYWITNTFTIGPNTSTFSNNACIKFNTNAYLFVDGPVSFPSSGLPVIFTSADDNAYGTPLPPSIANPGYAANPAVWFYYQGTSATMQDALVRWAQQGVEYTVESGGASQNLYSSVFQDCTTGVTMNMPNVTLYLSGDTYCNVAIPISNNAGSANGSMTKDCGVVSVAMVNDPNRDLSGLDTNKNSQTECSFAVLDSTNIVAAFMNTHLSAFNLGYSPFPGIPAPRMTSWAVSTNNGTNFLDMGPLLPLSTVTNGGVVITNGASDSIHGDAGDTTMAYDSGSNVAYLLVNPSRDSTNWHGFRPWESTNKGQNFSPVNMDIPGLNTNGTHFIDEADKPIIKVNQTNLYVAGDSTGPSVWATHSSNRGTNWDSPRTLETAAVNGDVRGVDIVILPDGTVYVFWLSTLGATNQLRYAYLATNNTWSSTVNIGPRLNCTNSPNGSGKLLRYSGATNDFFDDNAFPHAAYASGNIYICYADIPAGSATADHGDIFVIEAAVSWTTHALSVSSGPRTVNNDRTRTDQWDSSITANPGGTELLIGYYSRQNDPVTNSWTMAYGAKAYITNGLSLATFECFPVSYTSFQPFFAGTNTPPTNTWAFDSVWPPGDACLDTNAVADGQQGDLFSCPSWGPGQYGFATSSQYANFRADDYTWSGSDASYFYFAWCDCSRTNGIAPKSRPDADIRFAKIRP